MVNVNTRSGSWMPDNDTTYLHAAVKLYRTSQDKIMYSVLGVPTASSVLFEKKRCFKTKSRQTFTAERKRERDRESGISPAVAFYFDIQYCTSTPKGYTRCQEIFKCIL